MIREALGTIGFMAASFVVGYIIGSIAYLLS